MTQKHRFSLYAAITALLGLAAAIAGLSATDPDGVWLRVGMILMIVGAAMWLPRVAVLPAALLIWVIPTLLRGQAGDAATFNDRGLVELAGLCALAVAAHMSRQSLRRIEEETDGASDIDRETGVYKERYLRDAIERELVRSRRFGREFSVMLVGVDSRRQRFDYRDESHWQEAFLATAALLSNTRAHIDRVFRYGERSFALILPETGPPDVAGLIRRLNRLAKYSVPAEGEPGGPLPTHIGVTFFPQSATKAEDLLRRVEVAMRLAEKNASRVQFDGAEAPELPAPASLRRPEDEALSGHWLGAEAPDEETTAAWLQAKGDEPTGPVWAAQPQFEAGAVRTDRAPTLQAEEAAPLKEAMRALALHVDETVALIRAMKTVTAGGESRAG